MPSITMMTYEARLESFNAVNKPKSKAKIAFPLSPNTHPRLTPKLLAQAGFYHTPESGTVDDDTCKCFMCGISLGGWDEGDDPFAEHANRGGCSWGDMVCRVKYDSLKGTRPRYLKDADLPQSSESSLIREQTFQTWWPHKGKVRWRPTVSNLAKAGFVFTPSTDAPDLVQCPYCDYSVESWEENDDPWVLHVNKHEGCHFFTAELDGAVIDKTSKASSRATKASTSSRSKRTATAKAIAETASEAEDVGEVVETQSQSQATIAKPPRTRKPRGTTATTSTIPEPDAEKPKRRTNRKKGVEIPSELKEVDSMQRNETNRQALMEPPLGETDASKVEEEMTEPQKVKKVGKAKASSVKAKKAQKTKPAREAEDVLDVEEESQPPQPPQVTVDQEDEIIQEVVPELEVEADDTPRPSKSKSKSRSKSSRPTTTNPPKQLPEVSKPLSQLDQFANIPPSSPVHPPITSKSQLLQPVIINTRPPTFNSSTTSKAPLSGISTGKGDTSGGVEAETVIEDLLSSRQSGAGFTEEEKKMTLEQLIRHEYKLRYDTLRKEGEEMIARWEERTRIARKEIEAL